MRENLFNFGVEQSNSHSPNGRDGERLSPTNLGGSTLINKNT